MARRYEGYIWPEALGPMTLPASQGFTLDLAGGSAGGSNEHEQFLLVFPSSLASVALQVSWCLDGDLALGVKQKMLSMLLPACITGERDYILPHSLIQLIMVIVII